ncbi:MAG TPA: hypothetical protein VL358_01195 [Caulobacteraceae bacterium]|jgi:hypothetical protein|nr:hypothetical protein [Caulobacteraceae bacterium]
MIALALAAALAQQAAPAMNTGNWVVVAVQRVIAPDQTQGQCFVQGKVEQVVHGRAFRRGDAIALSVSCRASGFTPAAYTPAPAVPTIQALRAQKRVLVHVDAAGRVLENGYYGFEAIVPVRP